MVTEERMYPLNGHEDHVLKVIVMKMNELKEKGYNVFDIGFRIYCDKE
jgi:hypothetical protein